MKTETVTVSHFMLLLTSKLTQDDMKQAADIRFPANPWRLGHLLRAANNVSAAMGDLSAPFDTEAAERMRTALATEFTAPPIAPVRNVLRQIDAFLASGKRPSIVRR